MHLTISVPQELFDRLQPVKDTVNVSRTCQAAISEAVEDAKLKRAAQADEEEWEEILERLEDGRRRYDIGYRKKGAIAGASDARTMSYRQLVEVADPSYKPRQSDTFDNVAGWAVTDLEMSDGLFNGERYAEGWIEGVREFWDEAQRRLASRENIE